MSEPSAEFFEAWSVYDLILDHNSMFHNELFDDIRALLAARYGDDPFTILELGCGSARHSSQALAGRRIQRYVGYDLSQAALAQARANLGRLNCPLDLKTGDLLDGLERAADRYDVILSSFAIHHLSAEEKRRFFGSVALHLNSAGTLLLIDPFRDETEDRATYLDRYCDWIRTEWRGPTEEGISAVIAHVRACDFPETAAVLAAMAAEAGLLRCWESRRYRWHQAFAFRS